MVTIPGTGCNGTLVEFGRTPGLYDWVVFDDPSGCTTGNASGLEDRVGDAGRGDGLGVRASGESGIWSADFRRFARPVAVVVWSALLLAQGEECSLCFST